MDARREPRSGVLLTALLTPLLACEEEPLVLAVGSGESMVGRDLDASASRLDDASPEGGALVCYTAHEALWATIVGDAGHHATSCHEDEDCVPAPSSFACSDRRALIGTCPWPIAAGHLDAALSAVRALAAELCPRLPVRCLNTVSCPAFLTRCLDRQCRAVLIDAGR